MGWIPESAVDYLPDEVLAIILERIADSPPPTLHREPPFPVAASRVSRRWRTVALGSPELWTTIRISHRSQSWRWAAVFFRRSGALPLDISINLESYVYRDGEPRAPASIPVGRALALLAPTSGDGAALRSSFAGTGCEDPIDASTIRSLAVCFSRPFYIYTFTSLKYWRSGTYFATDGFESLTRTFSLPNLEHLGIRGGFTGSVKERRHLQIPDDWQAPPFPHLRSLRLEDVAFSRPGLAYIHSFSHAITSLELIYTTGNDHLLEASRGRGTFWPALSALTAEGVDPRWLSAFVEMRAALGPGMGIADLTLDASVCGIIALHAVDRIHCLRDGPSLALIDGHCGFYVDEFDAHVLDFQYVSSPHAPATAAGATTRCKEVRELGAPWDVEQLEEEIAEAFKTTGKLARGKGACREVKKERTFVLYDIW
ncbi:hypothetical protein FB451DRAFT_1385712 [Mycena latifolia]|nr:hypothetical protein FB451DRAFT_1385712 [Mycena latifolia]